jgi:hypothetical protein
MPGLTPKPAAAMPEPNAAALRKYVDRDKSRADIFSSPDKLKAAFAAAVTKAYNRAPGADYDANGGMEAKLYHGALANIYNISDYSPPGWRDASKD